MTDPQTGNGPDKAPAPEDGRRKRLHTEELLDEALDESFPASDPPSIPDPRKVEGRS